MFSCRERTCKRTFTDRSDRDRHEKRFNHKPAKYNTTQPLFNEKEKKYCCPIPGCSFSSKFKGKIISHMKDYVKQLKRKEEIVLFL